MTKVAYRKEVTRACHHYNEKNLKDKMRKKDGEILTNCRKIVEDHKKVASEVLAVLPPGGPCYPWPVTSARKGGLPAQGGGAGAGRPPPAISGC